MTERLNYGLNGNNVFLDTPNEIIDTLRDTDEDYAQQLSTRNRYMSVDPGEKISRLEVQAAYMGDARERSIVPRRVTRALRLLNSAANLATPDQQDENLSVGMGAESPVAKLFMQARFRWPDESDEILQEHATAAMRQTATDLRFYPKRQINQEVFAIIDRKQGVTFETNVIGSCSLDTDGYKYRPENPEVIVYGHNLHNSAMQLICLSGLIAVAKS